MNAPDDSQAAEYAQALEDAGYGDTHRQQYIANSNEDPDYAACNYDELIVPAAVAAGIIPEIGR